MTNEPVNSPKIYHFLATAIELAGSDKGNVQFMDEESGTLKIVAHMGFNEAFLEHYRSVDAGHPSVAAKALKALKRVVVEDVRKDPELAASLTVFRSNGIVSAVSSPLFDEKDDFFGVITAHYGCAGRPDEGILRKWDAYLEQAAPVLARKR